MDKLVLPPEPFLTDRRQIKAWLKSVGVRESNYKINADGLVDVPDIINLRGALGTLKRLPVRFGIVDGDFWCDDNQLVSLEGAPKGLVGGDFSCTSNQLVSLEGAPEEILGYFACSNNQLVNLKGAPKQVGDDFYCNNNQLVSLEGAPKHVAFRFECSHNLLVDFKGMEGTSIKGGLFVTNGTRDGQDNVFISLEGLPKELYGKVSGLDIKALLALELELAKKRAASLLGDGVKGELSSEVELG